MSRALIAGTPLVLAIDASTTACKAVAFDSGGTPVAIGRAGIRKRSPAPGWQEQDARDWWTATCSAVGAVTRQVPASAIRALCIAHQRETFVCLDQDWSPIRPAILWLDTRAVAEVRRLGTPSVHRLSGKPPSTIPSFYKLAWLAGHEPEVIAATSTIADVHAYLVGKLTGSRTTSWASADPMGLVDMQRFEYGPELVAACGLRMDQLPALAAPGTIIGEVSPEASVATSLLPGLPVVAGGGDGQLAGLGAAICRPNLAYLNLGTGVTLGTDSDRYLASGAFRSLSSPVAGRWTLEALLAGGTLSVAWFCTAVAQDQEVVAEQRLEGLAAGIPAGADGLMFLPYLTSGGTIDRGAAARGAWVGLREHHGRGHMYRAILEGIGFEQRLALSRIEAETGQRVERLRSMGGGSRSRLWLQMLANILARPVEATDFAETTALGAGILAASAIELDGEKDVVATAERMTGRWLAVEPLGSATEHYERLAAIYERIYPALAPVFADLAELSAVAD
jgi:xylulokinase